METRQPLSSSPAVAALHSDLVLEPDSWSMLTPPPASPSPQNDTTNYKIGVIRLHPCFNRIAYTTTTRSQYISDKENIGETRIIVHDLDCTANSITNCSDVGKNVDSKIVASFTLHELNAQIIEFRDKQNHVMNVGGRKLFRNNNTVSGTSTKCTVQMLGTVQNIDFLSHDEEFAEKMECGDEDKSLNNMQHLRLMVGFRQCVVIVSVKPSIIGEASICSLAKGGRGDMTQGLQVIAYIGPDLHLDDACENRNEKNMKKLPSSFPVPISETIVAYGCYDGGIRFYDILRKKTGEWR